MSFCRYGERSCLAGACLCRRDLQGPAEAASPPEVPFADLGVAADLPPGWVSFASGVTMDVSACGTAMPPGVPCPPDALTALRRLA
jgi:hypothetical protein